MNSIGAVSSLGNAFSNFLEPQYTRNLRSNTHHYRHYHHPNNSNKSGLFVSPLAMKEKIKERLIVNSSHHPRPFSTITNHYTSLARKKQNNTNASSNLNIVVNKKSSINGTVLPPLHSEIGSSLQKISKSKKTISIGNDENPPVSTSSITMTKKKLGKQSSYPKLTSRIFHPKDNKKHTTDTKIFRALNFHKKMSKHQSEYFPRTSTTITSVKTGNKTLKESAATGMMSFSISKSALNNTEKSTSQFSSSKYPISTPHSRDQEFRSLYGRLKVHYILQDETVKNLSIPEKLTRIIKNLELFEKELIDYLALPNALPQAKAVLKDLRSRRAEMNRKLAEYSIQSIKNKSMKETPFPNIETSVPFNSRQQINSVDDNDIDKKKTGSTSVSTNNNPHSKQPVLNSDSKTGLIKEKVQQKSKLPRIKLDQSSKNDTIPSVILSKEVLSSRKKGYKKYSKKTLRKSSIKMVTPLSQQEQEQPNQTNTTVKSIAISKPTSESKMKKTGGGFSSLLPIKWRKSEFIKLLPHSGDVPKNTSKVISENPVKLPTNIKRTENHHNNNTKSIKIPSIPNPNDANLQSWALPDLPNYKNYMSWLEEMMAMKLAEDIKNRKEESENDHSGNENENDSNKTMTKSNNVRNLQKSPQEQPPPKWSKVPENPNATKQKHSAFIKEFTSRLTPKFKAELEKLKPHLNHNIPTDNNSTNLNNSLPLDSQKYISPFEIKGSGNINNLSLGRHQTFPAPAVVNPFPDTSFTFHSHHSPFVGTNPVDFQAVTNSIKSVVENTIIGGHQNNLTKNMNPVPQLSNHINSKNITSNSNYEQPKPGTRSTKLASDPQSLGLHVPKFVHPKTATGVSSVTRNLTTNASTVNRNQVNTLFSLKDTNYVHSQNPNLHLQEESREEISNGKGKSTSHLPLLENPVKYSQPRNIIPTMTTTTSQLQPPVSAPCTFRESIEKDGENLSITRQLKCKTAKGKGENKIGKENNQNTLPNNSLQSFVGTSKYLQPRNPQVTTHDNMSLRNDEKSNADYNNKHNNYTQNQNFKMMSLPYSATLAVPISHINAKLGPSLNQSSKIVELSHRFLDR